MKKAARKKKESFFEKVEEQIAEVVVPQEEKKMRGSFLGNFSNRRYQIGAFLSAGFTFTRVAPDSPITDSPICLLLV